MFVCCQEDRFWTRQHPILAFQVLSFGVCHDARARHRDVPRRLLYRNVVFAGAPKIITNKLQRVLNSAARVVTQWYTEVRPRSEAADAY